MSGLLMGLLLVTMLLIGWFGLRGLRLPWRWDMLWVSLAGGLGAGVCSALYFASVAVKLWFPAWHAHFPAFGLALCLLVIASASWLGCWNGLGFAGRALGAALWRQKKRSVLFRAFLLTGLGLLFISGWCLGGLSQINPYGQMDALAIWNLHAGYLLSGVQYWAVPFWNLLPWWQHADYPLLLPGLVAQSWQVLGGGLQAWVPAVWNALFAYGTVALLYGGLRRLVGSFQATVAVLALLASPFFFCNAIIQVADIPVGFYLLATGVAIGLAEVEGWAGAWVLAGMMATLAAWTKNEGLWWVGCLIGLYGTVALGQSFRQPAHTPDAWRLWRWLGWIGVGLLPGLALLWTFKAGVRAPNDVMAASLWAQCWDVNRHRAIFLAAFPQAWFIFSGGLLNPLTLAWFAAGWGKIRAEGKSEQYSDVLRRVQGRLGWLLIGMLCGFYGIYLISPHSLQWHLDTSIYRLLIQLWPLALLRMGLGLPTPVGWAYPNPTEDGAMEVGANGEEAALL